MHYKFSTPLCNPKYARAVKIPFSATRPRVSPSINQERDIGGIDEILLQNSYNIQRKQKSHSEEWLKYLIFNGAPDQNRTDT
ncbi:MAG: hypothetical protein IPJ38_01105 [Dechloromonas sp.]|uniref:Uncharacterized protein n=1 Tax=Candidatus Dechloromonas phosphorivorans TaxID=2899244 RepID=A0A935JZS9_9RHOO|nr:hypothetical protein [Candidatus Dechloromonas phosphorivorans]